MTKNDIVNNLADVIMNQSANQMIVCNTIVDVPQPQKAGTSFQQRTYAVMKARDIVNKLMNS